MFLAAVILGMATIKKQKLELSIFCSVCLGKADRENFPIRFVVTALRK